MTVIDLLLSAANLAVLGLTALVAVVVAIHAFSRLLFARVEIQAFEGPKDDQAVLGMSEIVRSELVRLTEEGAGMGPFFLNGPDKPIELPGEVKTTQLTLFTQIVSWLPGRITTVTGRIQPEGGHGRGVTVTIQGGANRNRTSITIWEKDVGQPVAGTSASGTEADTERYQRLAIAAAAWVAYRLVADLPARSRSGLLTQDWLSHAMFLIAARAHLQGGDADRVRAMYQSALERDPRNRGALFGLGLVFANEHANRQAAAMFDACLKEVVSAYGPEAEWVRDRLWYRAALNAAIVRLNDVALRQPGNWTPVLGANFPDADSNETLVAAAQGCLKLVARNAELTIRDLVGDEPAVRHGRHGELIRFLTDVRDYAIVNYQASAQ